MPDFPDDPEDMDNTGGFGNKGDAPEPSHYDPFGGDSDWDKSEFASKPSEPFEPEKPEAPEHAYGAGNAPANLNIDYELVGAAPMYRDGITTTKTYLILAVKKNSVEYNCICQGNGKIKFYPNPQFFNVTDEDLVQFGIDLYSRIEHHGYVRYEGSRETAAKLLEFVATTRGTVVISPNMLLSAAKTGHGQSEGGRRKNSNGGFQAGFPGG